jgi:hypothetical protein
MAEPTAPTIAQILEAIKGASKENIKAFKDALGVKDATSSSVDTSGADSHALDMLKKQAQLTAELSKMKEIEYKAEKERLLEIAKTLRDNKDTALDTVKQAKELIAALETGGEISLGAFKIPQLDEQIEKVAKLGKQEENVNKARAAGALEGNKAIAKNIAGLVGLKNYSESATGQVVKQFAAIAQGGEVGQGAARDLGLQLTEAFSPQAIGLAVFNKVFSESMDVLDAFDKGLASLSGKTGTVGKFNDVLYDTQRAGNLLGVTMDGAANAIVALNAGTSQFAKLSKKTQTDLAISTSQMEALGVSASDTADFMENAFKIMNMSASEAIDTQTELAMSGVALGMTADKMIKDFNGASKTLAVYGKGSVKVFKGLAAQAKAAGVEVSTLLGVVEKFDTFSGAAEGAAQFNALLGTQLSTTQMLMMTEDERMKTLVESVQAQGIAFGDMDKFTQKSIAAAAGITDMNEANRIFSMSLGDYEANRREMENNAAAQQKFDDAVQATVPTMKKFQNLATEMIVMVQPALEKLGEVADYLTDFMQGLSKETKETVGTIALFVGGLMALAPLLAVGGGFMAGLAAIGPAIAAMGAGIATGLGAVTAVVAGSAGVAGGVMLAFLAGGAVIGATMAAMAESDAKIAESNAKMVGQGSDTIKAMADIGSADFSGIATKFKGVMQELATMGSDVKVTSTLQNLALMNTGTAFSLTGAKIAASATNVTANVSNIFDGMKLTLEAGGQAFEAYIKDVAATTAMT